MPELVALTTGDAITIVVPTRNRAYTLRLVAESYFQQDGVDQIIFVDDASDGDTAAAVAGIAAHDPHVRVDILRNKQRIGASASRKCGVAAVTNKLVLSCDNDGALQDFYTHSLYRKYWDRYAKRVGLRSSRWRALACFAAFSVCGEFLRPTLAQIGSSLVRRGAVPVRKGLARESP